MARTKRTGLKKQVATKQRKNRATIQRAENQRQGNKGGNAHQLNKKSPGTLSTGELLLMQRTLGNRAVSQMIQAKQRKDAPAIQTKLRVGPKGDAFEQEADRVADQVMSTSQVTANTGVNIQTKQPQISLQTAPANGVSQSEGTVVDQRSAEGSFDAGPDIEGRLATRRGFGQSLSRKVRAFMEPRFGHDLRDVRVHTDGEADSLNRSLDSEAFTTGQDVYFREGAYDPGSPQGKRLLAHELTHVVQQGGGSPAKIQRAGTKPRSFSVGGRYMIKLSSAREKFVYENKGALGMSRALPGYYPVTSRTDKGDTVTHVKVDVNGNQKNIELKDPIQKPEAGQEILCIETLGYEDRGLGKQRAGKGDKFVMDIKIGSHTKSMEQFRLEGANGWLRFRKNIEHGLKDKMSRWIMQGSNKVTKIISKLFRGSRGRGYDICDGEVEFREHAAQPSGKFKSALDKIIGDMLILKKDLTKKDISFVGGSVFLVFNTKNPGNSVAKFIDPDHPILMDEIAEDIQKSSPKNVLTKKRFGFGKLASKFGFGNMSPEKYEKLKKKLTAKWTAYQNKWKAGFRNGLDSLLDWLRIMHHIVERRNKRRILSRPLPKPPPNRRRGN